MGIQVDCPACGHSMKLKSFLAGKRGICPKCQKSFDIPSDGKEVSEAASATIHTESRPATANARTARAAATGGAQAGGSPAAGGTAVARPVAHPVQAAPVQAAPVQATPVVASPAQAAPVAARAVPAATPVQPGGAAVPVMPAVVPAAVVPTTVVPAAVPVARATPAAGVMAAPTVAVVAPVDPLVEAPQAQWYIRPPSGGQFGPAAADLMRQWMQEGRVTADSLVWRDGWADWKLASATFPQFMPQSAPVAQAVAAGEPEFPIAPPAKGVGGRPIKYRRSSGTGRMIAIIILLVALAVLVPLLAYVLRTNV